MGKFLIVLIILGGAGYYAYSQGWIPGGEQPTDETDPTNPDGQTNPSGGGNLADGGGSAGAPTGPTGLTEAQGQAVAAAEAAYQASANASQDAQAPEWALTFSRALRASYGSAAGEAEGDRLVGSYLEPLADRLFWSPAQIQNDPTGLFTSHTIGSGDNPDKVSRRYAISPQFLNLLRGRAPEDPAMQINNRIKVVNLKDRDAGNQHEAGFYIHIDKSRYLMDVFVGGVFLQRFPIGIGAENTPTPITNQPVRIDQREREMDWTHPVTGEVFAWNQPGNILGGFWMRLDPNQLGQPGIGIHGYNGEGQATGVKGSNGCIRMRNEDAERLYQILTPVGYYDSGFITRAPMWVEIRE